MVNTATCRQQWTARAMGIRLTFFCLCIIKEVCLGEHEANDARQQIKKLVCFSDSQVFCSSIGASCSIFIAQITSKFPFGLLICCVAKWNLLTESKAYLVLHPCCLPCRHPGENHEPIGAFHRALEPLRFQVSSQQTISECKPAMIVPTIKVNISQ